MRPETLERSEEPAGATEEHDSDGQACLRRGCVYYMDTDGEYHALRRDGQRNECEATAQLCEVVAWLLPLYPFTSEAA